MESRKTGLNIPYIACMHEFPVFASIVPQFNQLGERRKTRKTELSALVVLLRGVELNTSVTITAMRAR